MTGWPKCSGKYAGEINLNLILCSAIPRGDDSMR